MKRTAARPRRRREAVWWRSRALVAYWDKDTLVVENYLTGAQTEISPLALQFLHGLDAYTSLPRIRRRLGPVPDADRLLDGMIAGGLLVARGSDADARERKLAATWKWGPAAQHFHFATRNVRFESLAAEHHRLAQLAHRTPPPSPFRDRDGPTVKLPAGRPPGDAFWATLARRRTRREVFDRPIRRDDFAAILRWSWGRSRTMNDPGVGPYVLKTSASGGARHPIEVYPVVMRVEGVAPGVYHYSVRRHALTLLRAGQFDAAMPRLCADQPWVRDAAALFFMTAFLPRAMWKYRHAHAYRVVQLDAGHLGQTFHLVCTRLGLAPFTTAALRDGEVEALLGIDGIAEIPVYAAAVGIPRRGLSARRAGST
ncbi:MAG: SagB family peptide dehydrogenase [Rhodospirillales bacterium]|nr:SagB family peptide dehydrogenase [Rhodospirillales bacterium]